VLMMLRAVLGLDVDGVRGQVTFSNPMLPDFLDVLHIEGLRVGRARVDLRVHSARRQATPAASAQGQGQGTTSLTARTAAGTT